jgi:hypothetical protein
MADKEYIRLTRARLRFTGFVAAHLTSLWLGKDHLLAIDSIRYVEEYKRFYFRDIQAITIRTTRRRSVWNFVLMLLLLFWLAAFVSAFRNLDRAAGIIMAICVAILAVPLLINNILGPTCTVYLRTAVQIEELPSLGRVRRTRKVLARIRLLIAAVQGQLTPEEIAERLQEANEPNYA